ncbi:MAG: hypothetical protein U0132_06505 [Gemmatimonadaceae bacterium]
MIRLVRHFATRLRRGGGTAPNVSTFVRAPHSAAWTHFDQWLQLAPQADATAHREQELAHEHARVAFALIGQAGSAVVARIGQARATATLVNEDAARFTLALACARGDRATRAAACAEISTFS